MDNNNQQNKASASATYLIKGDISGIQGFIFNVKSDGAARSLKGRSFFLKILLEVAMRLVFDYCDVPKDERRDAEISTSGGNFILKLSLANPNKIDEVQAILTESLQYIGLNIMLCVVAMEKEFSNTLKSLNQAVRERKQQLFLGEAHFFDAFDKQHIKDLYGNTSKADKNKWTKITEALKNHKYWKVEKPEKMHYKPKFEINGSRILLVDYTASFINDADELKNTRFDLVHHLESVFPKYKYNNDWKKIKKGDIIKFEDLSKDGEGIDKLGVLAMDVDNLGKVIEKIKDEKILKNFDAALRQFFNDDLRVLIETEKYWDKREKRDKLKYHNKVYTVTAGGDDSFFVGKWNTMLDLAIDIHCWFEGFKETLLDIGIKNSNELSISAALVIVKPKFPVVRFAEMTESALKTAKYRYSSSRGNINIFGKVVKWEVLRENIYDIREALQPLQPNRKGELKFNQDIQKAISGGMLARVRFNTLKALDDEGLRLSQYWELGYFMRNYGEIGQDLLCIYRDHLDDSFNETDNLKKLNFKLIFPIAARLAELDNRK